MDKDSRVYLSGPIDDHPGWVPEEKWRGSGYYRTRARKIQNRMRDDGIGWIVNRIQILSHMPYGFKQDDPQYMTICYALMTTCDTLYLLKGWRSSEICKKEKRWAEAHGMKIEEEKHDDLENYR